MENSHNVKEFCPICGKFENSREILKWIECEKCKRWIHNQCDSRIQQVMKPLESNEVVYYSPICTKNFDIFPHVKMDQQQKSLLPNGLIDNPEFYTNSQKLKNFVIARYSCTFQLTIEDYSTLNSKEYLSNTMFHICAKLIFHENLSRNIKIWSIYKTDLILFHMNTLEKEFFEDSFFCDINSKINIVPLLKDHHYSLIVLDFLQNHFYYIDPLGSTTEKARVMLNKFENFIDTLNVYQKNYSNLSNINIILKHHVLQKDSYNCGIYILHFIKCIINNFDFMSDFNPDEERIILKNMLLRSSLSMKEYCLQCGRKIMSFANTSHCQQCKRYTENNCCKFEKLCPLCEI